jgi:hypothetical protein
LNPKFAEQAGVEELEAAAKEAWHEIPIEDI